MKSELENKIIELWHISRTALCTSDNGRGARFQYVMRELKQRDEYKKLIEGMSNKKLMFLVEDTLF
jgi:hypothetical protein